MRTLVLALTLACGSLTSGCDALGIETPEKAAAARDLDGKAVGGACRHAGRAIEDCYLIYKKADRAAVFAGWRDMNDYMRENNIDTVTPQLSAKAALAQSTAAAAKAGAKATKSDEASTDEQPAKAARPQDS